jgi:putative membrane protein
MKTKKSFFGLVIRGLAMGAADVVPGVSGGTIAFITGIYEELLETISNVNSGLIKTLKRDGLKAFWIQLNGSFLVSLFLGIGISIVSLAKLISYLLETYPVQLWSFFFGLIIASIWLVGKTVEKWNVSAILALLIGTGIAYYITLLTPTTESANLFYIFICGSLAICAMILPGISGSFILLLLGTYTTVLGSINNLVSSISNSNWGLASDYGLVLLVFGTGCIFGILSFSKLLNFLFKKVHNITVALLTGFLIGSLNKIWPWKQTMSTRLNSHGETVPFIRENVFPAKYEIIAGESSELITCVLFAFAGLLFILIIEKLGNKNKTDI